MLEDWEHLREVMGCLQGFQDVDAEVLHRPQVLQLQPRRLALLVAQQQLL